MNISQINSINFGICLPKPKPPKLYTKQQALDKLLDRYQRINNELAIYRREQNDYFDSIPKEEFERPISNPKLDGWAKYFSIIQQAKLKKAGLETALDRVSKLPPIAKVYLKLD